MRPNADGGLCGRWPVPAHGTGAATSGSGMGSRAAARSGRHSPAIFGSGMVSIENQITPCGLPLPEDQMADTTQEPKRVNVDDASAAAYWARRFQVPVEDVKAAVQRVGDQPAVVAAELGKPWPYEASGIV